MLNTYRVIALSLVTALFFAAPLLCIHPISTQIKKAEHRQNKRVRVVSHRATHNPQVHNRNVSAAWARSIHRAGHKTFHRKDGLTPWSRDEGLDEDYTDLDVAREDGAIVTLGTVSHSDL
jgi:hypothetical protein